MWFAQEAKIDNPNVFPIIGLGASAGGLEALEAFFRNVTHGLGSAFVIVQHLDPTHKGLLAELLQRVTFLTVVQITDSMKVEPDHVYVIPPNKDLSILHGVLHLLPPGLPRGLRLPIDFFFRSLAEDQRESSIAVIFSGMGSDGALGLRAIKENGGAVFVQEPTSAKFDSMPRNAIETGLIDETAPAEELPQKILNYLQHVPLPFGSSLALEPRSQSALDKIFILLRARTGHDFSLYKKTTIYRRIERRMGLHQIDKIGIYFLYLDENPQEVDLLFKELLIGVTNFFRDPPAWDQVKKQVLPALLESNPDGKTLRAWIPGCSTGEEAYSLSILFQETLDQVKPPGSFSLQVFASDLDREAINKARQGVYPANIAADVSPERLQRFFIQEESGYRVSKEIRERVVFASQNVVMDPPFTHLDLLVCRNLLIYLTTELQKKLIPLFYYCLNPGGFLFLGAAETIWTFADLFSSLEGNNHLFRRINQPLQSYPVEFPSSFNKLPHSGHSEGLVMPPKGPNLVPNLQTLADQVLLRNFSPAAVLVNTDGDILYVSGHTGKYLELATGKAAWNIFAMAREGLSYELSNAFQKASREKTTVVAPHITIDGSHAIKLTIQPQEELEGLQGTLLIVFEDTPLPPAASSRRSARSGLVSQEHVAQLEKELLAARDELSITREMMQTSQEELRSTNEELQSTNEELQSTNEELTTSKEEMQSMNEELQTVNHELQMKLDDLARSNNDLKNLLNSTDIATLFLDDNLCIRRFTTQASKIIKLIPSDAGRPITDIASDLIYPELTEDVHEVLNKLVFSEKTVTTRDGRWFVVRVMPYRTLENRIDGVVITLGDITLSKTLELELRKSEQEMKRLLGNK